MINSITIQQGAPFSVAVMLADAGLFKYIFLSAVVLALGYVIVWGQTRSLVRAKRIIRERDEELRQLNFAREELAYKNKNVTDSIIYARKIQDSLIPSVTSFEKHFRESFVFFKPRDIVSGDFYFIREVGDRIYVVAADCTGHGVPGALMSMIGLQTLDRIIAEAITIQPGEILNTLSREIEITFSRDHDESYMVKDSMDIAVCVIDRRDRHLEFAGAFLPVYLLRDGNLLELKGDKFVIGRTTAGQSFTSQKMSLEEEDTIYLFTDGYVDQFGGTENKKFMNRRFRYLLVTIHKYSMADQKTILADNITTWMGSNDQVDDIMVLGFRP
jgi:serine phosphatase RsbU (regulator of sigma subunit)